MVGVLCQVQVRSPSQLLFNDQCLLEQLESSRQKLVLDFQKVPFAHVHLEGLIDDAKTWVILNVAPTAIAIRDDSYTRTKRMKVSLVE